MGPPTCSASHHLTGSSLPRCALTPSQAPSAAPPGRREKGDMDDFILVSKDDEGGSARAPPVGQAQAPRPLRSSARRAPVFSDPLTGPASASASSGSPSSSPSPDDDSSGNSKDSGFTIVSPLDL